MNNILVIAPHPDDETLGCGGTILKHKMHGDKITWLIITTISVNDGWSLSKVQSREKEIEKASEAYDFDSVIRLNIATTKVDIVPLSEVVSKIRKVIENVKPSIIYVNNHSDIHSDHQAVFNAVASSTKNFRFPFINRILMYETLSETEFAVPLENKIFIPNCFVDITDFFDKKCEIFKMYESEVMESPYPRSLKNLSALARFRGARIGVNYAESFNLLLEVIN